MKLTAAQRAMYGRLGAAIARSRHDPQELTANARKRFLDTFERQVCAEHPDLPAKEVARRAGELKRAHFIRLSIRSSEARASRRSRGER